MTSLFIHYCVICSCFLIHLKNKMSVWFSYIICISLIQLKELMTYATLLNEWIVSESCVFIINLCLFSKLNCICIHFYNCLK